MGKCRRQHLIVCQHASQAAIRINQTARKAILNLPKVRLNTLRSTTMPEIAVGDKLPETIKLSHKDADGNIKEITVGELTAGKKVVIFSVPGAFTPVCSRKHLPGFIDRAEDIKAKGIDTIVCLAVNDPFVMEAWGQSLGVGSKVLLLADGNAEFAKATGTDVDLSEHGLGMRSKRYALFVEDGVVKSYAPEPAAGLTCSSADSVLTLLESL